MAWRGIPGWRAAPRPDRRQAETPGGANSLPVAAGGACFGPGLFWLARVPFYGSAMARHLLFALLVLLAPLAARAGESAAIRSPRATATLVAVAAAVAPGQPVELGLRLRLAPGWHTYWQNPGDAGAPPEVTILAPAAAEGSPIRWPAPARIPTGPLVSFGYEGEVLLPFRMAAPAGLAPGDRLTVEAEATWLVCAELCIPEEGRFRLDLPVAGT